MADSILPYHMVSGMRPARIADDGVNVACLREMIDNTSLTGIAKAKINNDVDCLHDIACKLP